MDSDLESTTSYVSASDSIHSSDSEFPQEATAADVDELPAIFQTTTPPVEVSLLPLRRTASHLTDHYPPSSRFQLSAITPLTSLRRTHSLVSAASTSSDGAIIKRPQPTASGAPANIALFTSAVEVHNAFAASVSGDSGIPNTFDDALSSPEASLWKGAIAKELDAHSRNSTWTLVHLPPGRRAIGCRWVFTIKETTTPPTYKARLVAQGFRQVYGLDYFETFSPVVRYESIRILFAVAVQFDLVVHQMDVTTAFLNGHLQEEIYMNVPAGVDAPADMVCKLNRSLYGLKQAPLAWNVAINKVLVSAGFKRSISELGIYSLVDGESIVLVALYVDDLLVCSNSSSWITKIKGVLASHYEMKDLGLVKTFLGMNIHQTVDACSVSSETFLNGVLANFGMESSNSVTTPFASGCDFTPGEDLNDDEVTCFRSMVGKLLFAANTCRPDLAFATSTLSRFIKDPKANHLAAAKHVLRYIKGTLKLALVFKKTVDFKLVGYSDSDWAGDKADRKSITGYVFMLGSCAISWKSKKQQTVALSSTEAEYMALGDTVKELLWLVQVIGQIGLKMKSPPTVFEDNEGCKLLTSHPVHHQRTKHIDIRHHFIRNHLAEGTFDLQSARTDDMFADMFTKNLERLKFKGFVKDIGLHEV